MSQTRTQNRDMRWDGWPVAAKGASNHNYPVIDPTDPDWVAKPTPWDGIPQDDSPSEDDGTLVAAVESLKERIDIPSIDIPRKTPG